MNDERSASAILQLTDAFARLGAAPDAAKTMAGQLWRRAEQLAAERGSAVEEEVAYLLAGVAAARRGGLSAAYEERRPPQRPPN